MAQVQSLVGELRSHKPHTAAKQKGSQKGSYTFSTKAELPKLCGDKKHRRGMNDYECTEILIYSAWDGQSEIINFSVCYDMKRLESTI